MLFQAQENAPSLHIAPSAPRKRIQGPSRPSPGHVLGFGVPGVPPRGSGGSSLRVSNPTSLPPAPPGAPEGLGQQSELLPPVSRSRGSREKAIPKGTAEQENTACPPLSARQTHRDPPRTSIGHKTRPRQRDWGQRVTPVCPPRPNPPPSLGKPQAGVPGWVNLSSHSSGQQNRGLGLGSAVPRPGEGPTQPDQGDPAPHLGSLTVGRARWDPPSPAGTRVGWGRLGVCGSPCQRGGAAAEFWLRGGCRDALLRVPWKSSGG